MSIVKKIAALVNARHQPIVLPNRRRRKWPAGGRGWTRALRLAFREQSAERFGIDAVARAPLAADDRRRLRNARKRERQEARR